MINASNLALFFATAIVVVIVPGPDTLYVVSRSLSQGHRAGAIAALGVFVGNSGHTLAATIGLSALLMTSALAYSTVKYAGAAYLVYLGIRAIVSHQSLAQTQPMPRSRLPQIFSQAVLTNLLNPKAALFFLALLPQFVEPGRGHIALQTAGLGLTLAAMSSLWLLFIALLTGAIGTRLQHSLSVARFWRWLTGITFIGLGVRLATSEQR